MHKIFENHFTSFKCFCKIGNANKNYEKYLIFVFVDLFLVTCSGFPSSSVSSLSASFSNDPAKKMIIFLSLKYRNKR